MEIVIDHKISCRIINDLIVSGKGSGYLKVEALLMYHVKQKYIDVYGINKKLQHGFIAGQIQNQFLSVCDMLLILKVNFDHLRNFEIIKPLWVRSTIENEYILVGALDEEDIQDLKTNNIKFKDRVYSYSFYDGIDTIIINIELPPLFFSQNPYDKFICSTSKVPYACTSLELYKNDKSNIISGNSPSSLSCFEIEYPIDVLHIPSSHTIKNMTSIKLFNWIERKFDKISDKYLEDKFQFSSLLLLQYHYVNDVHEFIKHTVLFERDATHNWITSYFPAINDINWVRYFYMEKLEVYDLFDEVIIKNLDKKDFYALGKIGTSIPKNDGVSLDTARFQDLKRKLFIYDKKKQLFGVSAYMPLTKILRQILCSCSGEPPFIYNYKFIENPRFFLWREINSHNLEYPFQAFFKAYDYYVFKCIPKHVADRICVALIEKNPLFTNSYFTVSL